MSSDNLRSLIFVPGYEKSYLSKAKDFQSDVVILDIEDSVPDARKAAAREYIMEALEAGYYSNQKVLIRVNSRHSQFLQDDIKTVMHDSIFGYMFPKARTEEDVHFFDKMLAAMEGEKGFSPGKFKICPLIETSLAVLRAYDIAIASPRIFALGLGGEDYLTDLDGLHKEHGTSLLVPRSLVVIAARAAGVAPIDTPYLNVHDLQNLRRELELARELGFSGSMLIHPTHIGIANQVFTPSQEEWEEAKQIVQRLEESKKKGLEVALFNGKLIGPPMKARALRVVEKMKNLVKGNS